MVNSNSVNLMCGLATEVNSVRPALQWDWSKIRDHEARFPWSLIVPIRFLGALTDTRSI